MLYRQHTQRTSPKVVLGLGYEVGRIKSGYAADFVAVEGEPIKSIELLEAPSAVIKGGIRYR